MQRDLTDIIRENQESCEHEHVFSGTCIDCRAYVPDRECLCRTVFNRRGNVSISSDHCPLHGPKPNSAEFARIEAQEAERRLANGE